MLGAVLRTQSGYRRIGVTLLAMDFCQTCGRPLADDFGKAPGKSRRVACTARPVSRTDSDQPGSSKRRPEARRKPLGKARKPSRARVFLATHIRSRIAKTSLAKNNRKATKPSLKPRHARAAALAERRVASKPKLELRRKPNAKARKPSRARVFPATHSRPHSAKASPVKTNGQAVPASERTEQGLLESSVGNAAPAETRTTPALEADGSSLEPPHAAATAETLVHEEAEMPSSPGLEPTPPGDLGGTEESVDEPAAEPSLAGEDWLESKLPQAASVEAVPATPHSDDNQYLLPNIFDDEPEPEGEPGSDQRAADTILSLEIDVPGAEGDLEVGRIESQEVISPAAAVAVEAPEVAPIQVQIVDRPPASEPRAEKVATAARLEAIPPRVQAQKTAWQRFAEAFDDSRIPAEPAAAPRGQGTDDGAGEAMPERSSRPRVLAVDDDAITRKLLKMGLACHGYDCETAENGSVAQEIVQTYHPDVIVLDLLMPVMDGLSFLSWLRQTARATTPVVVLTNLGGTEIVREAVEVGANSVLRKPVHLKELLQVMQQFVPV